MFIWQSILCGILAYLSAQGVPWALGSQTGSFYVLARPLVAGLIVGAIFGNIAHGIIIGAALQVVLLSGVAVAGTMSVDYTFASWIAIPIAMQISTKDTGVAISLASALAVIGILAHNLMNFINTFWIQLARKQIEDGNVKAFFWTSLCWNQLTTFILRFTPAFVCVLFGSLFVTQFIHALPHPVITCLSALGGMLPALGLAIIMRQSMKLPIFMVFFLTGFVFVAVLKINMIGLAVLGALFAFIYYTIITHHGGQNGNNSGGSHLPKSNKEEDDIL